MNVHMMKPHKKTAAFVLLMIFLFTAVSFTSAEFNIPETIKVGLYYNDSSHSNTAVASFSISAKDGLAIGFFEDNKFTEIYNEEKDSSLTVSRDNSVSIVLDGKSSDLDEVNDKIKAFKKKGIEAYPVYDDSWQVWSGLFADEGTARQQLENIQEELGEGEGDIAKAKANRIAVLDASGKPLSVFGSDTAYFRIKPLPENDPEVLSINGKQYRGSIEVRRLTGSDMTVINVVKLEEYLYGNVPPEIGGNSAPEALKAQAMASKMYAINNIGKHKKTGFDVCATTHCQVYRGYSAEIPSANKAIDETEGKVITYEGKLATQIFYFASSAGRTEDAVNVWGYPYPYLKSVEDKYEPIYTWTKTLSASDVKAKIPDIGNVLGMSILKTSEAGRVTQLAVRGDSRDDPALYNLERSRTVFSLDSQLYTITTDADVYIASASGDTLKAQLGGKKAATVNGTKTISPSGKKVYVLGADGKTKAIPLVPETYTFSGKGWGHAVGMSQEGARAMGKAGIKFDDIITHYFPGTEVE